MSNINPAITFQLNMTPDLVSILHPDKYQSDQDVAQSQETFRTALIDSWFPGLMDGENIERKSANTFTAYGSKAYYILKTYAVARPGQPPLVNVVSWNYSDGSSNAVGTTVPVYNGRYSVGNVTVVPTAPVVPV